LSSGCYSIEVKGLLSYLFPLGVDVTEEIAKSIIGKPIHEGLEGKVIGKIDAIDWEKGEWRGRIVISTSLEDCICNKHLQTMRFKTSNT
jgi:hypothetical protein